MVDSFILAVMLCRVICHTQEPGTFILHVSPLLWRRFVLSKRRSLLNNLCWFKIFTTDALKIINITKHVWKLPTSTQLRAICHSDSLHIVVLPSAGASRLHNCCINGGTSLEYFGYSLVLYMLHSAASRKTGSSHTLASPCSYPFELRVRSCSLLRCFLLGSRNRYFAIYRWRLGWLCLNKKWLRWAAGDRTSTARTAASLGVSAPVTVCVLRILRKAELGRNKLRARE
jgi:hypothetical protein